MNIPDKPHYAIVTEVNRHVEGDERSRTNPGHGYPAHTETYIEYEAFEDKDRWEERIRARQNASSRGTFVALKVFPVTVRTEVIIETPNPEGILGK